MPPSKCCTIEALPAQLSGRSTRSCTTWCSVRRTLPRPSPPRASLSSAQRTINRGQNVLTFGATNNKETQGSSSRLFIRKLSHKNSYIWDELALQETIVHAACPSHSSPQQPVEALAGWRVKHLGRKPNTSESSKICKMYQNDVHDISYGKWEKKQIKYLAISFDGRDGRFPEELKCLMMQM